MIVKVEIEAGPELKKLLERIVPICKGVDEAPILKSTGDPKTLFNLLDSIKKKIDVPKCEKCDSDKDVIKYGTLKKGTEKETQRWRCKACDTRFITEGIGQGRRYTIEIRKRALELLKTMKPKAVRMKLKKEFDVDVSRTTLFHWSKDPTLKEKEKIKETPKVKTSKVEPSKRMGTKDKRFTVVREEGIELLKEGKKPKKVFKILQEKHGLPTSITTVYQWSHKINKKAKEASGPPPPEPTPAPAPTPPPEEEPSQPEEPEPSQDSTTPTPTAHPQEPVPLDDEPVFNTKINIEALKSVKIGVDDLMIINDSVMCPKTKGAVDVDSCNTSCGSYIAMVKDEITGEPYVRCTKAGRG